jgi:hypothetical protein
MLTVEMPKKNAAITVKTIPSTPQAYIRPQADHALEASQAYRSDVSGGPEMESAERLYLSAGGMGVSPTSLSQPPS